MAMSHRLRSSVSMVSWNTNPSTAIGSVPRMTYHPIRASSSPRSSGRNSDSVHVRTMFQMSRRK